MTDHLSAVPEPARPDPGEPLEEWMRTHARGLRRMCARLLRDESLAEDIVQETLLRAWTRRQQFATGADVGPWLRCVARNLCIEHLRTRGRMIPSSDALPDHADTDADPTAPIERAEEHRYVREALLTLSDRHRALIVARDVEGVDYAELARREGVNEDAARAVLFRARRILRDRYMAVARAVGAAVLWLRVRSRGAAGRIAGPALSAASASLLPAAAASVVAVAAAIGSFSGPAASALPGARPVASGFAIAAGSSADSIASPREPLLRAPGGTTVAASVDRRAGSGGARATARNPLTGDEEYVWTRVWRQQGAGDDGSVVLGAADQAADTTCGAAPEPCDTVDDVTKNPEGTLP